MDQPPEASPSPLKNFPLPENQGLEADAKTSAEVGSPEAIQEPNSDTRSPASHHKRPPSNQTTKSKDQDFSFQNRPPRKGTLFQLGVIIGVSALVATLFTAWTPGRTSSLFSLPTRASISQHLQPTPTFLPGAPTVTLTNPRLIGIVAGHWKNDSGAVCADGLKEVDLNLNIATRVQKNLVAQGYEVDLLQEFDPRLEGYQSAALVSIHNDSCDFINNEATGFKVAAAFATHHPERAARLTACLRARYGSITGLPLHSTSVTSDMTSYHAFGEIDENTVAAIIETGFMNLDRSILTQQPDLIAEGITSGILCYLRNESVTLGPTPMPNNEITGTITPAENKPAP